MENICAKNSSRPGSGAQFGGGTGRPGRVSRRSLFLHVHQHGLHVWTDVRKLVPSVSVGGSQTPGSRPCEWLS